MSDRPDSIVPGTGDVGRSEGSWCWTGPGLSVEMGSSRVLVSRRLCEVLLKHRRGRNYSARKTRRPSLGRLPLSSSWNDGGGFPGGMLWQKAQHLPKAQVGAFGTS